METTGDNSMDKPRDANSILVLDVKAYLVGGTGEGFRDHEVVE